MSAEWASVSWGEAILAADFHELPDGACRNIRLGGDGRLDESGSCNVFFLYMATARADCGKSVF